MSEFLKLVNGRPQSAALASGDIPNNAANTTGSAGSVSGTNVVTNSNLAQMATDTIKGNNTSGTANAADLTVAQVLTMLGIKAGTQSISSGVKTIAVTFAGSYAYASATDYSVTATMLNTTDLDPQYIPVTITSTSTTGFSASWNTSTPTANYVLNWQTILLN